MARTSARVEELQAQLDHEQAMLAEGRARLKDAEREVARLERHR